MKRIVAILSFLLTSLTQVYSQCSVVPVKEAVRNGDFEAGYLSGSGLKHTSTANGPFDFYSDMDFKGQNLSSPSNGCHYGMGDGYVVAKADNFTCASTNYTNNTHWGISYGGDVNFNDHTAGLGGAGHALLVDLNGRSTSPKTGGLPIAWEQTIDIYPSESYWFSAWVANFSTGTAPVMQVTIIPELAGVPDLANQVTVPATGNPTGLMNWTQMTASWIPVGIYDKVTLRFEFVNVGGGSSGLDVAIDDISFINSCQNIASQNTYTADFNLPDTINLCERDGSELLDPQVPVGQRGNATVTWYEGGSNPQTETDNGIWTKTVNTPGTYRVCVDDPDNGCPVSDVVTVIENYSISIADIELCNPAQVSLDAGIDIPNGAMASIAWSGPSGSSSTRNYTVNAAGAHSVTITASGQNPGCGASDNFTVTSKLPTAPTNLDYCDGGNVTEALTVGDGNSYSWSTSQTMSPLIGSGTSVNWNIPGGTTGDQTLWLQSAETAPLGSGGPNLGTAGGSGNMSTNITTSQPVLIKTVQMGATAWAGGCGAAGSTVSATVDLMQGATVVSTKTVTVSCGSQGTVALDMLVPAGNYTLRANGGPTFMTTAVWSGSAPTYSIGGALDITGYSAHTGAFGQFVIESSEACEPIPVIIKAVSCCTPPTDDPAIDFANSDTSVCAPLTGNLTVPGLTNGLDFRWETSTDLGVTWTAVGADGVVAGGAVTLDPISVAGLYRLKLANTGDLDKTCIKISDTAAVLIKLVPTNLDIAINPNQTTFCEGEAHTLEISATSTAPGTITYSWSGAVTANTAQINGLTTVGNTHDYRAYATQNGCVDSLDQSITVAPIETATLTSDSDTVCSASGNVDLTQYEGASDAGTWAGSNVTGTNFDPLAAGEGKYKMVFTTSGTCSAKDSVYIIVKDKLVPTLATTDTSFCKADVSFQIRLAAGAFASGVWSGTGVNATGLFDATGLADGAYTVKYVTSGLGAACSDSDSVIVTINPLDSAEITTEPSMCNSDPAYQMLLNPALTTTGLWTDSLGTNTYINATGSFDPGFGGGLTDGRYKVYFVTTGACPSVDSAYVTVTSNIAYNMLSTQDTTFCLNAPEYQVRVDVGGGTFWTTSGTGIVSAGAGTYQPTQAGIDTIWYGKAGACGDTVFLSIDVNAMEDSTIATPDTTICVDEGSFTLRLGATATTGGTWAGSGVTGSTFDPTGLDGTYKVSYTTPGVCQTSDTVEVTVVAREDATVTMDTVAFCGVAIPALAKSASSGGTWTWRGADGNSVFTTVAADSIIRFDPTAVTPPEAAWLVYEITGLCGDIDSVEVTVSPMEISTILTPDTTVCEDGGNITLRLDPTATTGGTWTGNGASGTTSAAYDPNGQSGTEKVIYTSPGACVTKDSMYVTIKPRLDATVTMATTTFCGNAASAAASAAQDGGEWTWRGTGTPLTTTSGSKDVTFDPNGISVLNLPETAWLVYEIDSLCGASDSVQVTVSAVDVANFAKDTISLCQTDAAQDLLALLVPGYSAGAFTGTGVVGTTFDPATVGVVPSFNQVMYTTTGSCPVKDSLMVNVVTEMKAEFTSDTLKVCEDGSLNTTSDLTLATTKGGNFTTSPAGFVNINTGVFDVANATAGTTYRVYYKVAGGTATCADSDSVEVLIIQRENATINNADSVAVCMNAGDQNFTSANPNGTWEVVGGTGINTTTGVFDPTVAGVGVHEVVYTMNGASGLCPDYDTVLINVLDTPTLSLPTQDDLCGNGTVVTLQKTLKSGFTGVWSGSTGITDAVLGTFDPSLANGTVNLTYTVDGTCTTSEQLSFEIVPIMNPAIGNQTDSVCIGNGTYTFTSTDPNGVWTVNGTGVFTANPGELNLTASGGGIYTITHTITTTGNPNTSCSIDSTTTLKITTAGDPTIQAAGPFCENLSGQQLTNTGSSGGTWSSSPVGGAVNATTGEFYPTVAKAGSHDVTYSLGGLCPIDSTITIVVDPIPTMIVDADTAFGCEPLAQFVFTDNTGSPVTSSAWTISDGTPYSNTGSITHNLTQAGEYDVTLINNYANGCIDTNTFTAIATVNAQPTADFIWSPEKVSVLDPNIQFISTSTGATSYNWHFDRDADPATSTLPNEFVKYNVEEGDTFDVRLIVENNGCVDTIIKKVIIEDNFTIFSPNAFTPNGDGLNDTFFPNGKDHDNINGSEHYQFWIFNRWGEEIFNTQTPYEPWHGTHQATGNPVQVDVYVWKMTVWDNFNSVTKTFYGKVSVIK